MSRIAVPTMRSGVVCPSPQDAAYPDAAPSTVILADDGRYGHYVIGVRGVFQAKQKAESQGY